MELDDTIAEAYMSLGMTSFYDFNVPRSAEELQRAIRPGSG